LEQAQAISYTPANENPEPVVKPEQRPAKVAVTAPAEKQPDTENSPRVSTSDAKNWGINVGRFASRYAAEKMLLKTALAEIDTLDGSLRKVQQSKKGFEATFVGLNKDTAELACSRLKSREITCTPIDPS
jgi:D-alanyl-D-alanine carboxypeptidase